MKGSLIDKRGLSTIVTLLIVVLLVLVAIGIVWIVLKGIIETGTGQIDIESKCLGVEVRATAVKINNATSYNVTLTRESGEEKIGGVKLVFSNGDSGNVIDSKDYGITDIGVLETKEAKKINPGVSNPNRVEVTVYFIDDAGKDRICRTSNSFSFA